MPQVFKALASIIVWVLFIWGAITLLSTTVGYYTEVGVLGEPPSSIFMGWGLGSAELILAVVAMKLRQTLE